MKTLVSWTLLVDGQSSGGNGKAAGWEEVNPYLTMFKEKAGTLCLDLLDAPDPGPISMQLVAENGIYLVTVLQGTDDDTYVRSYTNPAASPAMLDVLGDCWDARQLTQDFDLVLRFFQTFCETGDVPRQWLA